MSNTHTHSRVAAWTFSWKVVANPNGSSPGKSLISVNLRRQGELLPFARRSGKKPTDCRPLFDYSCKPIGEQQCRTHLAIHELNLPPPAAARFPRGSPRGKTLPPHPPCVRSTGPRIAFLPAKPAR